MVIRNLDLTRHARLQGQRGAAVFIVVMVLTLLTAVGIFAVRSASMADVAAGFDREGAQASLVAQYGVSATAALLGTQGLADVVIHRMESIKDPGWNPPVCDSNVLFPTPPNPNCFKFDSSSAGNINASFLASNNSPIFAPSNAATPQYGASSTSSLNANETTDAAFVVELTEARSLGLPAAGSDTNTQTLHQVTITSIAQVRPVAACAAGTTTPNAAQTAVRSIITVGVTR